MTDRWMLGHVGQLVIFFDLLFLMMIFSVKGNFSRFDHIVHNPLFFNCPLDGHGYSLFVTSPCACCQIALSRTSLEGNEMKTYFDLLATLPQDALRDAVNLHIAANRAKTPESHDAADDAVNALKLNESQAHVFFDYMNIDWDNADYYLNAMRAMPIDFDIGDDLPGCYWCPDSRAVFSIDDIG